MYLIAGTAVGLILLIIFAAVGGAVARANGRDPLPGVVLGFVFGPIGVMLIAIAGEPPQRR